MLWQKSLQPFLDILQLLLPLLFEHVFHVVWHIWELTDSSQLQNQLFLSLIQLLLAVNLVIHFYLLNFFRSAFRPSRVVLHPLFPSFTFIPLESITQFT